MSGLGWGRQCSAVVVSGLLVTALAGAASAQMKPSSAEIKTVTGQVEVQKKGETSWSSAVIGARLVEGDEIRAHAGGSARLDLADGSTLLVAENSRLVVTKLEMDQQSQARRMLFHLVVGKVRAVVAKASIALVRARQSNFAISTPTAVAAVRGTDFEVTFDDSQHAMRVAVLPESGAGSTPAPGSM
jgi:hypothetical protein